MGERAVEAGHIGGDGDITALGPGHGFLFLGIAAGAVQHEDAGMLAGGVRNRDERIGVELHHACQVFIAAFRISVTQISTKGMQVDARGPDDAPSRTHLRQRQLQRGGARQEWGE